MAFNGIYNYGMTDSLEYPIEFIHFDKKIVFYLVIRVD